MMASSSVLKQGLTPGGCLSLHLAKNGKGLCSGSGTAAFWLTPQWQGFMGSSLGRGLGRGLPGRQKRGCQAGGVFMDASNLNQKAASTSAGIGAGAQQDSSSKRSIRGNERSGAAVDSPSDIKLEDQEAIGEDADDEYFEEEIIVVKEPLRRDSTSYQASIRQEVPPAPVASSYPGTPLFWVGAGVALAVAGSWVGRKVKEQAMQAAMKAMMSGNGGGQSPFGMPGGAGSSPFGMPGGAPFGMPGGTGFPPFPGAPGMPPSTPSPVKSAPAGTVTETTATPVQPARKHKAPQEKAAQPAAAAANEDDNGAPKRRKAAFKDVNEQELQEEEQKIKDEPKRVNVQEAEVVDGGTSTSGDSTFGAGAPGGMSVEAIEKMLEDPMVQNMIFPYLPEEMRNPQTFKWMMQNPMYRQQLEQMLSQMDSSGANPDFMKSFDLNDPEVKQQFDQIGMSPQEMIGKIMSEPEIATAFQNPKIQAAIMDVSANPSNMWKYMNDKEVMDVFNKIQSIFPHMG